ncbi:MAG: hypothetical protein R6X06_12330 [Gammaproteobacteria bacterium]
MASATPAELLFYAPGLLGPYAGQAHWPASDWPVLPRLEKFLSRADVLAPPHPVNDVTAADDYAALFTYFNLQSDPRAATQPLAALCLLAEGQDPGEACWMRLDPVCLQADRVDAVLIAHEALALTEVEADALQASLRPLLEEDALELHCTTPQHWYVRLPATPALTTTPLRQMMGQPISRGMPQGAARRHWHRFMNEVQMLWHNHPVNQQREQQGQLMATSVWPWGVGSLPQKQPVDFTAVYSDELVVQGLAQHLGIDCLPLSALDSNALHGRQLLVDFAWRERQQQGDVSTWLAALADWEQGVLQDLEARLRRDKGFTLILDLGGPGRFRITRRTQGRWWRRTRTLAHWLPTQ